MLSATCATILLQLRVVMHSAEVNLVDSCPLLNVESTQETVACNVSIRSRHSNQNASRVGNRILLLFGQAGSPRRHAPSQTVSDITATGDCLEGTFDTRPCRRCFQSHEGLDVEKHPTENKLFTMGLQERRYNASCIRSLPSLSAGTAQQISTSSSATCSDGSLE